jgi:hypothetical protein
VEKIRSSLAPDTPVEMWFQDEMPGGGAGEQAHLSLGQKGIAAAGWQSTYLFGAVCPELGTGPALVLPFCNSEAMQLHLDEIATKVGPGAHAIIILEMARSEGVEGPAQHLADAIAAAFTRAEQPGEYLAVHAPKLAVTASSNPTSVKNIEAKNNQSIPFPCFVLICSRPLPST